jgi:nucleotide-binding universal stress UspA family protein
VLRNLEGLGRKVLAAARSAAEGSGLQARTVLRKESRRTAAEAIVREAKRWGADAIVMGTHGRRGIARLVLGSDAEAVAASAAIPVLLVSSRAATARPS